MPKNLIIYGVGSFSEYVAYVFEKDSEFDVIAFCIEEKLYSKGKKLSKPLVEFEKIVQTYPPETYYLFIAVGNNIVRKRIYEQSKNMGYLLASYLSSKTTCWEDLIYGENTFIDDGCKIHPFVEIGNNSIVMYSTIGHHSKIGNHNLLSVCTLGGNVIVENEIFLGMNSVIKQNISIRNKSIIGMGCTIEKNTEIGSVYSSKGTFKRNVSYDKIEKIFLK